MYSHIYKLIQPTYMLRLTIHTHMCTFNMPANHRGRAKKHMQGPLGPNKIGMSWTSRSHKAAPEQEGSAKALEAPTGRRVHRWPR